MYGYGMFLSANGKPVSGSSFDADAQSFFSATGISDLTQKNAVNQLVLDLKSADIWTKIKALYPIVGGNATAHSYNLINTSQYQLTFYGGWTHSSNGMLPNGTNGYADMGFNSTITGLNSNALGVYLRSGIVQDGCIIGNSVSTSQRTYLYDSGGALYFAVNSYFGTSSNASDGFFQVSRTDSSSVYLYTKNNSQSFSLASTTQPNINVYLGALNVANSATGYMKREIAFTYWSDGLSLTEMTNFKNIVQTMQTSLSRQV